MSGIDGFLDRVRAIASDYAGSVRDHMSARDAVELAALKCHALLSQYGDNPHYQQAALLLRQAIEQISAGDSMEAMP